MKHLTEVAAIDAHGRHAQAVSFTKDGALLVSAGQDASVRLWSLPDFAPVRAFEAHKNSVNSLAFNPDETMLATGSTDGTVRIWSFPGGKCVHTIEKQMAGVFSPDGDRLATIAVKGQVTVFTSNSWKQLIEIAAPDKRHGNRVQSRRKQPVDRRDGDDSPCGCGDG